MHPFHAQTGRGDPLEVTLERLRRARKAVTPDERQPEMEALLLSMEGLRVGHR